MLNAAHGRWNVDTGPDYYRGMAIEYYGVEADDLPSFDLSVFFYPAAAFIDTALRYDHSKRQAARPPPRPQAEPRPSPFAGGRLRTLLAFQSALWGVGVVEQGMSKPGEAGSPTTVCCLLVGFRPRWMLWGIGIGIGIGRIQRNRL